MTLNVRQIRFHRRTLCLCKNNRMILSSYYVWILNLCGGKIRKTE